MSWLDCHNLLGLIKKTFEIKYCPPPLKKQNREKGPGTNPIGIKHQKNPETIFGVSLEICVLYFVNMQRKIERGGLPAKEYQD